MFLYCTPFALSSIYLHGFVVNCVMCVRNSWAPCQWLRIPILFPIDADGFAYVSSLHLSIRFSLQDSTLWVKCKIYDGATSLLSLTMCENSRLVDNGSSMWELCAGKYRVYGLLESCTNVSTKIRTLHHSFASTLDTPPLVTVKIEPSIHTIIHLHDSSDGDKPPISTPIFKPSPSSLRSASMTPPLVRIDPLCTLLPSFAKPFIFILQCLRALASMHGRKNIL